MDEGKMDIEELVDQILDRALHGPSLSDDEQVDERITRSDVWNLVEEYTDNFTNIRIAALEEELKAYEKPVHA